MPEESLTARSVHGLKWSYASTAVSFVLNIAVTAVLARLVAPSAFGLVAMAGVFISFGNYFSQLGIGQAVVQRKNLSSRDVRTAFTSSVLVGTAFSVLFVALAPLAALLFPNTPGVVTVARAMSLTFLLGGLMAVPQGLLQRRMDFRTLAIVRIASYVLGYALIGLVLASVGFDAWSLVIASLAQGLLAAITYVVLCRAEIGFGLGAASLKSLYSFGSRVSLIGFVEFIGTNLDTLWTGHYLGARATGLYTRATNFANLASYYVGSTLTQVLFPGYSRIQSERQRLKSVYLTTITVFSVILMPFSWGVAGAAHEVIATLLGERWLEAAPVLAILSLAVPFNVLTVFAASLCEATARLNARLIIAVGDVGLLAALLLLLTRFGIVGVASAFALSQLATHTMYLLVMRRLLESTLAELLRSYVLGLTAGVVTGLALFGIHAALGGIGWPSLIILLVQMAVGAVCLLTAITRAGRGTVWREIRWRLVEAGYGVDRKGAAGWIVRVMDKLT